MVAIPVKALSLSLSFQTIEAEKEIGKTKDILIVAIVLLEELVAFVTKSEIPRPIG